MEYKNVRPIFPQYSQQEGKTGIAKILHFFIAAIMWLILGFIFLVGLYIQWFTGNLVYLLQIIHPKAYYIPFWFSLILVIFATPLTFLVIILGTFIKIIRR